MHESWTSEPTLRSEAPNAGTPEDDPLRETGYRFIARLGEGGMGEVVEAEHLWLGHRVAIKLLRAEHYARFELKDRMRLEAQACARIRNDHLVPVTDYGETVDGRVFVVMDLLRGRSLGDEVKARGALPVREAIDLAVQALTGLAAAHKAGILHRDIKPDNLFICDLEDGARRVKVLDFGIAKIVDAGRNPQTPAPLAQPTAEGLTVGTPRYASPEQSRAERDIDVRSDLYSMGLVLHVMLTGQPPFPDKKGHVELWRAHETEMLPLPSTVAPLPVPSEIDRIVMKAVSKRREDRYASADAFRADLARLAGQLAPAGAGASLTPTVPLSPTFAALLPALPARLPAHETVVLHGPGHEAAASRPEPSRPTTTPTRGVLPSILLCAAVVAAGVALAVALRLLGAW